MLSNEVDETSLYVVLDKPVFSQSDEVAILSPQRPLVRILTIMFMVVEVELCCFKMERRTDLFC